MTSRSGAPRHFMMAMVRSRPARKLEIALPTPTPPTSREASPIRPMNWVSRSSQKRMPPPASASPLTRQPASGKRFLSASMAATSERPGGRRSRYSQLSRLPGWTRPDSVTASKGIIRRGPRLAKAFSPRSGSRAMMPLTSTVTSPTRTRSPGARFMRLQRRVLDHRAPHAVAPGQRVGERSRRLAARACRRADRQVRPP